VCCSVLQCVAVCCSVLQCVAVCCSVLQCVAVCCNVLQCVHSWRAGPMQCYVSLYSMDTCEDMYIPHCNTLQHTVTHYNTLQHTAAHCTLWTHEEIFIYLEYVYKHILNMYKMEIYVRKWRYMFCHVYRYGNIYIYIIIYICLVYIYMETYIYISSYSYVLCI